MYNLCTVHVGIVIYYLTLLWFFSELQFMVYHCQLCNCYHYWSCDCCMFFEIITMCITVCVCECIAFDSVKCVNTERDGGRESEWTGG